MENQDRGWQRMARMAVLAFLGISLLMFGVRMYLLLDDARQTTEFDDAIETALVQLEDGQEPQLPATVVLQQMAAVQERADDSVTSAEIILSFLEGAAVLVGLAIGAAALYGFNQINDINHTTDEKLDKFEARIDKIEGIAEDVNLLVRPHERHLSTLGEINQRLEDSLSQLEQAINDIAWLLQADQEFRLKNYSQAMRFAEHVLHHNPENPLALYILGWLKVQYVPEGLDEGIDHLENLLKVMGRLDWKWLTAQAAYGVALRRKARQHKDQPEAMRTYLHRAESQLLDALTQNRSLMDFNRESFWGPVGGIRRELGEIQAAIDAYEIALSVTPGSSYPQGNLATLYLYQATHANNDEEREQWVTKARRAFQDTNVFARAELATMPNDYFHLMDIAMSSVMNGDLQDGKEFLERALATETPASLLRVSLHGWRDLQKYTPESWTQQHATISEAIEQMESAIKLQSHEEQVEQDMQDGNAS